MSKELLNIDKYPYNNGACGSMAIDGMHEMTYRRAAELLAVAADSRLRCVGFVALSRCLSREEEDIVMPDGRTLSEKDLLIEALHLDFAGAPSTLFVNLGTICDEDDNIEMPDGRLLDVTGMYIEAISRDKNNGMAFSNLGVVIQQGTSVQLADGRVLSELQLFSEGIRLAPARYPPYHGLADLLRCNGGEGSVVISGVVGRDEASLGPLRLDMMAAFGEAIRLRSLDPEMYVTLMQLMLSGKGPLVVAGQHVPCEEVPFIMLVQAPQARLRHVPSDLLPRCCWSIRWHAAFRSGVNRLFGTMLLCLQRLAQRESGVCMDPAVMEEMLTHWSLQDTFRMPLSGL